MKLYVSKALKDSELLGKQPTVIQVCIGHGTGDLGSNHVMYLETFYWLFLSSDAVLLWRHWQLLSSWIRDYCTWYYIEILKVIWFLNQVELFKHPHLLLLQVRNSIFKLPGGRLRPGESGKLLSWLDILHEWSKLILLVGK